MKTKRHRLRVLHVCSEIFPYLKTGGLADVTGALPVALARKGCDARMLVPGFPAFVHHIGEKHLVAELPPRFGAHSLRLFYGKLPQSGLPVYYIDAPGLYDRPGNPYIDIYSQPYGDNHRRFALLGWTAARLAEGFDFFWRPQIIHGHDWHAGMAFAYLRSMEWHRGQKLAGTVFTIHNMAYQGNFPACLFGELDLPGYMFSPEGVEFYDQVSFLKAGLAYADKITTVSPTYAREIHDGEQSCGLGGVVQKRSGDITGILNGIDITVWNPATDAALAQTYNARSISGKKQCRLALQQEMGLSFQTAAPLFCVVSRFASQKGLNLVLGAMNRLLEKQGQIVVVGNGEYHLESAFADYARRFPQQVAVRIGYDEQLAHRVIAGSDVIMVPSRYEPCGLTQFYGLRYGTLPLVHRVGGLADSVTDCSEENLQNRTATGFVFNDFDVPAIEWAIGRAFALFGEPRQWRAVQRQGMRLHLSWKHSAEQYRKLYEDVVM
ncbi:MAG: glycogen synthase GlgA [Alistipes senegalensis]|nr:glycogen synthase GlgA [Oxalobacter formigenes]MCM1281469.1 glycogen synthase GlgA [Alistipes senegalensis]